MDIGKEQEPIEVPVPVHPDEDIPDESPSEPAPDLPAAEPAPEPEPARQPA